MHVQRRQEDADLLPRPRRGRFGDRRTGDEHAAVGWRHDRRVISGTAALGIAKEEKKKRREDEKRDRQRPRDDRGGHHGHGEGADDERETRGVDARADQLRACGCAPGPSGTDGIDASLC